MEKPKLDLVEVENLYNQGYTQTTIAKTLGVSTGVISRFMRKHKIAKRPHGSHIKLDPIKVAELYNQGYTQDKIAKHFGVTLKMVIVCIKKHKITRIQRGFIELDPIEVEKLYSQGQTQPQLAQKYGVSVGMICNFMHKHNIKARTRGPQQKPRKKRTFNELLFLQVAEKKDWWNSSTAQEKIQFINLVDQYFAVKKQSHTQRINKGLAKAKYNGRSGGRPTYYDPEVIEKIKELRSLGKKSSDIYKHLGIARATYFYILKTHPLP